MSESTRFVATLDFAHCAHFTRNTTEAATNHRLISHRKFESVWTWAGNLPFWALTRRNHTGHHLLTRRGFGRVTVEGRHASNDGWRRQDGGGFDARNPDVRFVNRRLFGSWAVFRLIITEDLSAGPNCPLTAGGSGGKWMADDETTKRR